MQAQPLLRDGKNAPVTKPADHALERLRPEFYPDYREARRRREILRRNRTSQSSVSQAGLSPSLRLGQAFYQQAAVIAVT